ncbi:hypothetical protein B0O99DRAFT_737201 [Bisporella sp. PMI_857]|nr:hypothetical protein B0O99DRAFT_737201 [Bisporella sp. PMI_857]
MRQTVSLTLSDGLVLSSVDVDGWITNKGTVYNTQWIDCSYPISGGYERTPRYLFYTLIMVSFLGRKLPMVTGVALGSIMVYSGTAAVHALALFIIRYDLWPEPSYNGGAPEIVLTGTFTDPGNLTASESTCTPLDLVTAGSWFPLVPMAWDSDNDAVLAITGVAFLVIAPMQAWSKTFRNANAKAVLLLWSSLLLFGVVLALINEEIITNHTFPQLQFYPRNFNDTLPMTNGARYSLARVWDRQNLFRWNTTITNFFNRHPSGAALYDKLTALGFKRASQTVPRLYLSFGLGWTLHPSGKRTYAFVHDYIFF